MAFPIVAILDALGVSRNANTLPNAGQNAKVDSLGVVIASDDDIQAKLGIVTETAPASDTASSGLNGRLQRIAQRITSLIALLPASLGTKTAAASLAVTLASDGQFVTSAGVPADAAWTTGSGSIIALLKAMAANAISTAPSPVELGPFIVKQVAASQTNAVLGATGVAGDYLSHIVIQPASTSPGVVTIYDGSTGGTNVTVYSFPGGASSLSNLAPLIIALPANCVNAGWHVTTGASVAVTAIGKFT